MNYVKSKQRVADHGEVFTPPWMVEAMLDLVKDAADSITSSFLEPACGSGNFLVAILRRKLAAVDRDYGKVPSERRDFALRAMMSLYGIELLEDNIVECRENMLEVLAEHMNLDQEDDLYKAAKYVLSQNLIHGDAREMRTADGKPIVFPEWGYLGKARKFQRRNFRFESLAKSSAFNAEELPRAQRGKHEIFTPVGPEYPRMTMKQLAFAADNAARKGNP